MKKRSGQSTCRFFILYGGVHMNQKELQQLVETISLNDFGKPFRHQAAFNSRLRTTGGRYHMKSHDLDFNPKVIDKLGEEIFIGIVRHELCHYHLHLEGRGYQHKDRDFKLLLKQVGGLRFVPSLKEEKVVQYWEYRCTSCDSLIHRQRRFNMSKYVCARCKGNFELKGRIERKTAVN